MNSIYENFDLKKRAKQPNKQTREPFFFYVGKKGFFQLKKPYPGILFVFVNGKLILPKSEGIVNLRTKGTTKRSL